MPQSQIPKVQGDAVKFLSNQLSETQRYSIYYNNGLTNQQILTFEKSNQIIIGTFD